jgi:hypothetical protein
MSALAVSCLTGYKKDAFINHLRVFKEHFDLLGKNCQIILYLGAWTCMLMATYFKKFRLTLLCTIFNSCCSFHCCALNERIGLFGCKIERSGNLWYVVVCMPLFHTIGMIVFPAFGVSGSSCCIHETPMVLGTCSRDVNFRSDILSDCDFRCDS